MAFAQEALASSASHDSEYGAFLSFRGEDTRRTFTADLFHSLKVAGLNPFMDNDGIKRGETISSELERAIESSKVSIMIFSRNYATSPWCLDEVLKILQHSKTKTHGILPLFYHVDPAAVRHQQGSFGEALAKHESRYGKEKVEQWKKALKHCASLSGYTFPNPDYSFQIDFIDDIVKWTGDEVGIRKKEETVFYYDVFVSYKSKDIPKNIIKLLYATLQKSKFKSFEDEMNRKENTDSEFDATISQSRSSIIVFSRNYSYSPWCLHQLAKIFKYSETKRHVILPVFYLVDKETVIGQADRMSQELDGKYNEQFNLWRESIKGVAELPAISISRSGATQR
ncbi:hypothetical protein RJ640_002629 [Escallonia rubra]|uniref:ADP-ribosyl cyclase/cyclic ADP-ribose hydrolase n=1 Tax=Escallonia rubra TaxID=112253 RepID=A0AA88UGY6_9ASTE|nr:hypothetical protein RJ640_002629 [Escallonia rubra]